MASASTSLQQSLGGVENVSLRVRGTSFTAVDNHTPPPRVEYVTYAKLPCKCAPGPPIAASSSLRPRAASQATVVSGNPLLTAPPSLPASASPPPSPTTETATQLLPPQPTSPRTASVNEKGDSPFQAAQGFLFASGASLLSYANPALYFSNTSGLDASSGSGGTNTSCVEELSEEVQRNLLTSSTVAAALKERYDGVGATAVPGSSSTRNSSVDWKKIDWVRQQCRYTGEALLKSPLKTAHDSEAAARRESASLPTDVAAATAPPPTSDASSFSSPTAIPGSTEVGERSMGVRLMQSLLYPFTQPTAPSPSTIAAPVAPADNVVADTVVPHGDGVMTYLLYCKPKADGYGYPTGGPSSETAGVGASSSPILPVAPFLSPDLIPTAYCPPLTDIEITTAEVGLAPSGTVAATSAPPVPHLLLLSLIVYEGTFVHGRRHGRGRLTAYGRMVLECTWSEDVPSLGVPWLISPAANSTDLPAPTLWNVDAHVWTPTPTKPTPSVAQSTRRGPRPRTTATDGATVDEARRCPSCAPSGTWLVRTSQAYMGSLMLATVASKKLLAKMEACMRSISSPLGAQVVPDLHGTRYVALPVPHPRSSSDGADLCDAFYGLGWANHVVLLPDGFGEAHFQADGGLVFSAPPPASPMLTISALGGPFQPPLWVPETSSAAPRTYTSFSSASPCWQYCGQWSAGLPHGFGAEAVRLTDPTAASLAFSASTAGAGPPQYPWRSLFLGQYVKGKQCGPGTHHGVQGSEATEVVLCGTWPRHGRSSTAAAATAAPALHELEQTTANVVLLPLSSCTGVIRAAGVGAITAAASSSSPSVISSSFFSLQDARWSDNGTGDGRNAECSSSGGGFFPLAKLRQSTAALSGMWEPLFRVVDDVVARQSPSLLFGDDETGGRAGGECVGDKATASDASTSNKALLWQRAYQLMDSFVTSPTCVTVLSTFQACFAFMYGADVTATATAAAAADSTNGMTPSGSKEATLTLLHLLESAAAVAPSSSSVVPLMGYPWCPPHSWCAMAHLGGPSVPLRGTQSGPNFAGCLHSGLSDGATHRHSPPTASHLGTQQPSGFSRTAYSKKSPNSASRRPPLSTAAAALEPFSAAHTFTHAMHTAAALVSSLRLRLLSCFAAYPNLCEVVMEDKESEDKIVQYCWDITFGYVGSVLVKKATAVAVADVHLVWELLGLKSERSRKETLTDYFVALRRCRTLTKADMVAVLHPDGVEACDAGNLSSLNEYARRFGELLELHAAATLSTPLRCTPAIRVSNELQTMSTLLSELHALLGTAGTISGRVKCSADHLSGSEVEGAAMTTTFTLAQQEALLRWVLLSATMGQTSAVSFASCSVAGRHPFAFLLLGHFLFSGRVIPAYPILAGDSCAREGSNNSGYPSRYGLLLLLADMARATRELMHTYPSIRSRALLSSSRATMHARMTSVVCPLDTLALKLEYALSPCAALHLCASSHVHLISGAAVGVTSSGLQVSGKGGPADETGGTALCNAGAPMGSIICINMQNLSCEAQQWCRRELTDHLTVPLLEARLQGYWNHFTPSAAQHSSHHHSAQVDGSVEYRRNDASPPSPLMRWLLACLQSVLSVPFQPQPVVKTSIGAAPADSAPTEYRTSQSSSPTPGQFCSTPLPTRYTWKKFISAVFFSPSEREEWTSAHNPTITAAARALSLMDSCYVAALAYTLRELAGIELELRARFVFEDEDEDEEKSSDADRKASCRIGDVGERRGVSASATASMQIASLNHWGRERKNIFLSSSSSSSSIAPSPQPNFFPDSGVPRANEDAHTGDSSSRSGNGSCHGCLPREGATATSTQSSTPTRQRCPTSQLPSIQESPCDGPPRANGRPWCQSVAAATSAASPLTSDPVGKEWELTLVLRHASDGGAEQETTNSPSNAFFSTLTWEVMEQVCSAVLHQLQVTAQVGDAAETEKLKKAKAAKVGL